MVPPSAPSAVLGLPEVLDLKAAAPLMQTLLERRGSPLLLDGGGVLRLGAQCLQVLLSARASWSADGREFAIIHPSEDLLSALALLGVGLETPLLQPELTP